MYRGRKRQGEDLGIGILCTNGSGVPTAPDSVPVATAYSATDRVLGGQRLPIVEPSAAPAYFAGSLFLDEDFPAGSYTVVYRWVISGTQYSSTDHFEVIAGGHEQGPAISVTRYDRPHATHLVNKRRGGSLYRGRNPRL